MPVTLHKIFKTMFDRHKKTPAEMSEWTLPQFLAVITEPRDDLRPGEVECKSLQEAIEVNRKLKAEEDAC